MKILYVAPSIIGAAGNRDYALSCKKYIEMLSKGKVEMEFCLPEIKLSSFRDLNFLRKKIYELNHSFDLIHAELSSTNFEEFWKIFFLSLKYRDKPIVITVHDTPFLCYNSFFPLFQEGPALSLRKIVRKVFELTIGPIVENLLLHNANVKTIVTLTQTGAQKLKKKCGNKTKVRHVPLQLFYKPGDRFEIGEDKNISSNSSKEILILFFGYFRQSKGIEILIDAYKKLINVDQSLQQKSRLVLCGGFSETDEYYKMIRKKIADLPVNANVDIRGFVSNDDLFDIFKRAYCAILPYQTKETFSASGPLVRALGAGCPVVVSDISTFTEIVKNGYNGLLFRENDADDLCAKLRALIGDNVLRNTLSINCSEYLKNGHSGHQVAQKIINIYEDALNMEMNTGEKKNSSN